MDYFHEAEQRAAYQRNHDYFFEHEGEIRAEFAGNFFYTREDEDGDQIEVAHSTREEFDRDFGRLNEDQQRTAYVFPSQGDPWLLPPLSAGPL